MKRLALLLTLLTTGCIKVGPDFKPPAVPAMEEWIESEVQTTEDPICHWWKVFDDPALNDLVRFAYEENLTLKAACYRIMEARAALGIAIGEFFPQQQEMTGVAQRVETSKNRANPFPIRKFDDYQLGLQAAWELDFWGKYRRAIESEENLLKASYSNYDDVLVLLLGDVASTYVLIKTLDEQIAIVNENVKIQARGLEISEAQFEGGFVSELDVQQATTLLKDTESRLPDLERAHAQAQYALCVLLGTTPQDLSSYLGEDKKIPKTSKALVVNMPESLLYRRPDIRRSLYDAAAQSARIGVAYADFLPQVSLLGSIGFESAKKLLTPDSLTYTWGSGFTWPLFNYGRISSRVQLERMRFCELVMDYRNTVLQAYQEVEDGLVAYIKFQEQVGDLEGSLTAARRAVELSKRQYVEGMVDYTTVLNTQEALLREAEKEAIARGNIAQSLIATYKALGGGWEIKCE